tara:strand:+ start:2581 stop:2844 length:264 start_codon:yes stop_codon:yes gene_type:complete
MIELKQVDAIAIGDLIKPICPRKWRNMFHKKTGAHAHGIVIKLWKDTIPRGAGVKDWYYAEVLWHDGKLRTFEVDLLEKIEKPKAFE